MKKQFSLLALGLALSLGNAWAASHAGAPAGDKPMTAQQNKMSMCNKEAGDKKGDERKAFMSECLKKDKMTQQEKMKACNTQAGDKKGDERKKFMSDCLKSDKKA